MPGTLASLQRSIQRCLKDNNSNTNILKDQEFAKSREVLTARKRDLAVNNAKGNRPQAARELTKGEEDLLFQRGQFGEDDPEVLQRTVWWVLSLHFGFRARDESRRLQWGDIAIENNPVTGKQVLVWKAERGSKTWQGDGHCRAFNPKAYATENEHQCPVHLYLKFASHRPEEMKRPYPRGAFLPGNKPQKKACRSGVVQSSSSGKKQDRRIFDEGCEECRTAWKCNQPFCAKNLHFKADGCRNSC